jgi:hypothetical protein
MPFSSPDLSRSSLIPGAGHGQGAVQLRAGNGRPARAERLRHGAEGGSAILCAILALLVILAGTAHSADPAFTMVIDPLNPGGTTSFTIPLSAYYGGSYDFTVDWGDGDSEVITSGLSVYHAYTSGQSTYRVAITENQVGGFPAIEFAEGGDCLKVLEIANWGSVTWGSFSQAFMGCSNMRITATDGATALTGAVTDFEEAWYDCAAMTSFPQLDTSAATIFIGAWQYCSGLTSFPALATGAVQQFASAWQGCSGLTSFPMIDTGSALILTSAWQDCSRLTSFPALNTSQATWLNYAWYGCSGLTSFPQLTLGSAQNIQGGWQGCSALTSFPLLDVSSVTIFNSAWMGCSGLASFPLLSTGQGTDFYSCWSGCTALHAMPTLDLTNLTIGAYCFQNDALTASSYSSLLIAMAATNTATAVHFDGGFSYYDAGAATIAHDTVLIGTLSWIITDDGPLLAPVITSSLSTAGTVGTAFAYQIGATFEPDSFTATGLPAGLSVDPASGAISGTPTAAGVTPVVISATNATGTGSATLIITVVLPLPVITSALSASWTVGAASSYQITASAGPTSFGASGLLAGLAVDPASGVISGTPTIAMVASVTISATNATGTGTATLAITVKNAGSGGPDDGHHDCGHGNGLASLTSLALVLLAMVRCRGSAAGRCPAGSSSSRSSASSVRRRAPRRARSSHHGMTGSSSSRATG